MKHEFRDKKRRIKDIELVKMAEERSKVIKIDKKERIKKLQSRKRPIQKKMEDVMARIAMMEEIRKKGTRY